MEVIERYDRLFARILARGVARGDFRETDVHQTTLALTAPMLFLRMWKHSFGSGASKALEPKVFITHVVALLLHGLLRNPAPGTVLPALPPLTAQPWGI